MVLPDQAGSLQGSCSVSCNLLAANDPGIGSGWQQSKQNWTLLAVVGYWTRMACRHLYRAEGAPLQPSFFCCAPRGARRKHLHKVKNKVVVWTVVCSLTGVVGMLLSPEFFACHVDKEVTCYGRISTKLGIYDAFHEFIEGLETEITF